MKKIYVIYTGGTIGMAPSGLGYTPQPGFLVDRFMALTSHLPFPMDITFEEYPDLIDSSDIQPSHWHQIGQDIAKHYKDYDGFLVIHGTDTMAYTAATLSFCLENLTKPVILTGAQIPLYEAHSDGTQNIIDSLFYACQKELQGVYLAFGGRLLQGNRIRKIDTDKDTAYTTPNYPPLADRKQGISWQAHSSHPPKKAFHWQAIYPELQIVHCKLAPGYTYHFLTQAFATSLQGLVLESYGSGNGPIYDKAFLAAIKTLSEQGTHIINTSQCLYGKVSHTYATGLTLHHAGMITGHDLSPEAALAKLYYVLSKTDNHGEQSMLLQQNLRGEMTLSREND